MSRSSETAATTAVLALAAGAMFGAIAALLLAPAPGTETRRKIHDLQEDASDRLKRYANEARQRIKKGGKGENLQYDGGDAWI